MLRAPMSRMDILSNDEIDLINRSSQLVTKYSREVDRESAYEILGRKVEFMEKQVKAEAEEKEREQEWRERQREEEREWGRTRRPAYPAYGRRSRTPANPVVKVLTSATFVRGVLGILKKAL
jgi:hypothetical protein